jgi:hypothetical protein
MQNSVQKLSLNQTHSFQINCLVMSIVLNTQRGVSNHLPATVCAMGPFGDKPVFGNGTAIPYETSILIILLKQNIDQI